MTGPTAKVNGVGVRLDWPEHGIYVTLDRFKESGGTTRAELSAYRSGDAPQLLTQAALNLSSLQGRASFARRLTELCPAVPWDEILENAAVHGMHLHRRGEPVVPLSPGDSLEPIRYRANPLVYDGHPSLLFSDGGTGKSWTALLSAVLVETGSSLEEGLSGVQGRAIILDWEQDRSIFTDRLRRLVRARPGWASARPLYKRMVAPLSDDVRNLMQTIDAEKIKLVVLDSLGPAAGGDICSAETAMRTMQAVRSLGTAVLCTAHVSKSAESSGPYGSVFFRNLARSSWRLESAQQGNTLRLVLSHDKNNFGPLRGPIGVALGFAEEAVTVSTFDPQVDPIVERGSFVMDRIIQVLQQTGPMTAEALAGALGSRTEPVKVALSKENGRRVSPIEKRGRQYVWALRER